MKIKLTRNTIAGGKAVTVGQVVEVEDRDGNLLIDMGKALPVKSAPKMETAAVKTPENTSQPPEDTTTKPPQAGDKDKESSAGDKDKK